MSEKQFGSLKAPLIKKFKDEVDNLHEVDLGDFRRRLNVRLLRWAETHHKNLNPKLIQELKDMILYRHFDSIEDLKEALFSRMESI